MENRISWDEYFIELTKLIAKRSSCPRKQVGAIIVNSKNRIIASGYNGAPRGMKHCFEVGCEVDEADHDQRIIHAEANAIIQCGEKAEGGTLYVNVLPCRNCLNMIIQIGIKRIVYLEDYKLEETKGVCKEAGIKIEKWKG